MMEDKTGGPAFPQERKPSLYGSDEGLSIRDYMAAAALQGLLADGLRNSESISKLSYYIADAMLKERTK